MVVRALLLICVLFLGASPESPQAKQAKIYVDAVRELNEKHAGSPGKETEDELAKQLPPAASKALDALLASSSGKEMTQALRAVSEAAMDLDRSDDFARIRARLGKDAGKDAAKLDTMVSKARFVLRGADGIDTEYLDHFAEVLDGVLSAYDEVFGFEQWSKVPGKKLRVRVHLVDEIKGPPHFAPEFPFHSEIDFPVEDAKSFTSPTADGEFLFYGLCHELGHVIAMWGDLRNEADHHAWAHYTGVAIVEHLSHAKDAPAWVKDMKDSKWRSLAIERTAARSVKPSTESKEGVMALLLALDDRVGPKSIGMAINNLDQKDHNLRVNRVRYYDFARFRKSLLEVTRDKEGRKAIEAAFGEE
ncbi:MAG TPA: hypothetical protein VK843_00220 [Planctomycetota bacterium]|nr:hypothetical protein [Planctomycetota bacterium]